jgi:hypothetical protein
MFYHSVPLWLRIVILVAWVLVWYFALSNAPFKSQKLTVAVLIAMAVVVAFFVTFL